MASTVITRPAENGAALPSVCVKTGAPTAFRVDVRGYASPAWSGAVIVFGFLPWLAATVVSSQPYDLSIPVTEEAWRRFRQWRMAGLVAAGVGLMLGLAATAAEWGEPLVFLALVVVGLAAVIVNAGVNWCGVRRTREGALLLTRVHPAFRDAMTPRVLPRV